LKNIFIFLFVLLFFSCSELPLGGLDNQKGDFPFSTDFEVSLPQAIHSEATNESALALVSTPPLITGGSPGSQSLYLKVSTSDVVNHGNRSEVAVYNCANLGETMYFGWDMAIPSSDPDDYAWQIAAQWYQLPDFERGETFDFWGAHPPVTLVLIPGNIQLKTSVGGEKLLTQMPYAKGVWHRLVVGITFLNNAEGLIEASLDGIAFPASPFKTTTLWNRAGAYFKCGLYRGSPGQTQAPSNNSCYIDNLKISRIKSEVE